MTPRGYKVVTDLVTFKNVDNLNKKVNKMFDGLDNNKYKSEAQHQSAIVKWFWNRFKDYRGLLYHNFNNPRNAVNGAQLIALGLMKGNPDLTLAVPRGGFGALYIELKKPGEKPRPEQLKQMDRLENAGNKVSWSDNAEEAAEIIVNYLNLEV